MQEAITLDQSIDSTSAPARRSQFWSTPHGLVFTIVWFVSAATAIIMLLINVRHTNQYSEARYILQASYVAALLWYLTRTAPSVNQLPKQHSQLLPRRRYGAWVSALGIALMLTLTMLSESGVEILMLLMIVAAVWILVTWRREIRLASVVQGSAVALISYLAGLRMANTGFISKQMLYLLPALSLPMYIGGGLLFERTRLGGSQLLAACYRLALKSLLWGGLLFVPLGLFNALDGSPGLGITWVTEWWMPLWLPWFSGIAEEIWFRLFLVGLCFFLLYPAFRTRPAFAVIAAVLFSGITFGLGHSRTLGGVLVTGLLYGVPMAAVFARRDWEHAVGAHYVVNMIPWLMVFLEI
jgi:hypothetical protein